jgi:hypothetical protein
MKNFEKRLLKLEDEMAEQREFRIAICANDRNSALHRERLRKLHEKSDRKNRELLILCIHSDRMSDSMKYYLCD